MSSFTGGQDITMVMGNVGKCGLHNLSNEGQVLLSLLDFLNNGLPQLLKA